MSSDQIAASNDDAAPAPDGPDHAVMLTLAYDGAAFAGWARQPGQRTVQGAVEHAITQMNGVFADLRATSRTDAGVHATGQMAAFDPARDIPPEGWQHGLSGFLPPDVEVAAATRRVRGYSPRFDTVGKTYRYLLLVSEQRAPLLRDRT